jgi:hypothetical protein
MLCRDYNSIICSGIPFIYLGYRAAMIVMTMSHGLTRIFHFLGISNQLLLAAEKLHYDSIVCRYPDAIVIVSSFIW